MHLFLNGIHAVLCLVILFASGSQILCKLRVKCLCSAISGLELFHCFSITGCSIKFHQILGLSVLHGVCQYVSFVTITVSITMNVYHSWKPLIKLVKVSDTEGAVVLGWVVTVALAAIAPAGAGEVAAVLKTDSLTVANNLHQLVSCLDCLCNLASDGSSLNLILLICSVDLATARLSGLILVRLAVLHKFLEGQMWLLLL